VEKLILEPFTKNVAVRRSLFAEADKIVAVALAL
jgi:hypothetical protein